MSRHALAVWLPFPCTFMYINTMKNKSREIHQSSMGKSVNCAHPSETAKTILDTTFPHRCAEPIDCKNFVCEENHGELRARSHCQANAIERSHTQTSEFGKYLAWAVCFVHGSMEFHTHGFVNGSRAKSMEAPGKCTECRICLSKFNC